MNRRKFIKSLSGLLALPFLPFSFDASPVRVPAKTNPYIMLNNDGGFLVQKDFAFQMQRELNTKVIKRQFKIPIAKNAITLR